MNRLSVFRFFKLQATRFLASQSGPQALPGEQKMTETLQKSFPKAKEIRVLDISGGCGAMYDVIIESEDFAGKSLVNQHRMVNEALKEEIKDMHGLRISTSVPTKGNRE